MRIIIYEDNEDDVKLLKYYLREFFHERKIKYEVKVYTHSYRMYDEVDCADVVFLDIEGLNENGVKVAQMMRRLNKELLICFVTRFSKYALDGYRASANRYFLKPLKRDVFMKEFASFIGARIFSFVVEQVLFYMMVDRLLINDLISKLVISVVVIILNYIFSKMWIFGKKTSA